MARGESDPIEDEWVRIVCCRHRDYELVSAVNEQL